MGKEEEKIFTWKAGIGSLVVSLAVTGIGIVGISLALNLLRFDSQVLRILCLVLEAAAVFAGARYLGRRTGSRRFLWGLGFGMLYFLIVFLLGRSFSGNWNPEGRMILLLCAGSGMLGGMLS